ncbi:hypothetical protein ABIB54_003427 [Frigoribacterium sp. UYMn621]
MKSTRTIAVAAATAAAVSATLLLSGCTSSVGSSADASPSMAKLEHIHELVAGVEPGILLAATHDGLYRLSINVTGETKAVGPIGGLDFDPMGFTIADGTAYASGHPGPTTPKAFGGPNLGLITSTDVGATWTNIALTGTTDFHGLAVMTAGGGPARVFGIDESKQRIERSLDGGVTWSAGPSLVARDILVLNTTLYATTPDGLAVSNDTGATFTLDPGAPPFYLLAADKESTLVGVDTSGTLWTRPAGQNWSAGHTLTGTGTGTVQALAVDGARIFVADDRGITFTDNVGATWTSMKVHK